MICMMLMLLRHVVVGGVRVVVQYWKKDGDILEYVGSGMILRMGVVVVVVMMMMMMMQ